MSASSPLFLGETQVGQTVRVLALELEPDFVEWLRAVGIHEGERVTVLRRALFGGPIHVRTGSGGEFALNRQLARSIRVAHLEPEVRA
ncbi:ferrous iron transport protein A [Pendulispora albinea]|uniref:FeoA domain-containing protein n=1 Tax=Pendulispora albinea TaxID=2741071 RepID=A0ABZ2M0Z5_9BACT